MLEGCLSTAQAHGWVLYIHTVQQLQEEGMEGLVLPAKLQKEQKDTKVLVICDKGESHLQHSNLVIETVSAFAQLSYYMYIHINFSNLVVKITSAFVSLDYYWAQKDYDTSVLQVLFVFGK